MLIKAGRTQHDCVLGAAACMCAPAACVGACMWQCASRPLTEFACSPDRLCRAARPRLRSGLATLGGVTHSGRHAKPRFRLSAEPSPPLPRAARL